METANAASTAAVAEGTGGAGAAEEAAARAVHKRYEGLLTVKSKAIKGKGAWYWAHLEPILVHSTDTGLPKAVKLRCSLCDAVFSASNPSRTASEHLKRGTCPNFASPSAPRPLASIAPCSSSNPPPPSHHPHHSSSSGRKRSSSSAAAAASTHSPSPPSPYQIPPLALLDPYASSSTPPPPPPPLPPPQPSSQTQTQQQQLVLSGGKEDLGALALLEGSVKKLKSPKASPGPALSKAQADSALSLLSDWAHECCASVSFSALSHPKFRSFLHQVGLPPISVRELAGPRLDARFRDARLDSDARLHDALFFQLASHGWSSPDPNSLITLSANLPNGTAVFRKALFASGRAPSKYAEEVLWDAVAGAGAAQRCAGIVADRFKSKALRDLEAQHHWMINLPCQHHALLTLLTKDLARDLPLFRSAAAGCSKLAAFFNSNSPARTALHKLQLQELDYSGLLRAAPRSNSDASANFVAVLAMIEDVASNARPLQLVPHDESFKLLCLEDQSAREMAEMISEVRFWNELEAVHSLAKLIMDMTQELEAERPLVGQCLPLWEDLKSKVKEWCAKYSVDQMAVEKLVEKRFKKNYHPAWSAAFILDPLYLMKDASGKYLPPFKLLTPEQEKDVDKLIMRLVSREEAHIALMELMKWRSEGLDPLYAQAVQVKQHDPTTGKMRIANPQSSRLVWETRLSEFKSLGKVAVRLIFLHATSCGFKCSSSLLRWVSAHGCSRATMDRVQKMVLIAAQAKLDRRDFSSEEEKDAELFASEDDDVLNEVFVDASSV